MSPIFPIGEAARQSGVKAPTIRYYEQIGLLPTPPRTDGNRRFYGDADLQRLAFIRHSRELGFEIDAIRTLLTLQEDQNQSCASACAIARTRLEEVEQRIRSLKALKGELKLMLNSDRHGKIAECRVIEVLADHGKCSHPDHKTGGGKSLAVFKRA
jgi:DNA-binding transcriptional MerR regulator